ncbi:MAG TPA: hypothetical protein VJ984_14590 [Xanthomonadales bacterium]|nr:hypothetical protein [Xanthomonadales bacterium]
MKKVIITILILAVVGAGVVGWWFVFHRLDGLVEDEIARSASEAIGTSVTLDDVKLDILNGSASIENLSIGNPPGFNREHAVVFGNIEAALDFERREVARVVLEDARIFIEEKDGRLNVQELKSALKSRISETTSANSSADEGGEEEIVIQQFLMRSTIATMESDSLQRLAEVEIDQIEMRDLRGTPDQVAEQIALTIIDEITDEAQKAMLRKQLENLQDRALDELRGLLDDDEDG